MLSVDYFITGEPIVKWCIHLYIYTLKMIPLWQYGRGSHLNELIRLQAPEKALLMSVA